MKDGEERKEDFDQESKADAEGESAFGEDGKMSSKDKRRKKKQAKSKQEAFKEFKENEGKQLEEDIKNNRADLRAKKEEMAKLKEICNKAKKEIDALKGKLEEKNEEKQKSLELDAEEDVIDEEEFSMLRKLKDQKKLYRENFDRYKVLKGDSYFIQNSVDQLKEQLVFKFEVWYDENFDAPAGSKEAQKPLDKDLSQA